MPPLLTYPTSSKEANTFKMHIHQIFIRFLPEIRNTINNDEELLNDFPQKTDFSLTQQFSSVSTVLHRRTC